jgi:hypothetical protein
VPLKRKRDQQEPVIPQSVSISGVHGGAVSVGSYNYTVQGSRSEAGAAALQLDEAIAAVRRLVEAQAGSLAEPALGQVAALEQAARADPPDSSMIDTVCGWFMRNLPAILPAVLEVTAHPSVDTAIKAATQAAQNWHAPDPGASG